ncbi:CHAT domain-containing protein [Hugenholtzia roseola]|uniref:CHAT domain-containing protein n=1 Tax=Hugenholtzia roseola TaxID=1002 RepID=UPI000423B784|nr:CHAT domain-containing protein [Hugenholtzia roseola]
MFPKSFLFLLSLLLLCTFSLSSVKAQKAAQDDIEAEKALHAHWQGSQTEIDSLVGYWQWAVQTAQLLPQSALWEAKTEALFQTDSILAQAKEQREIRKKIAEIAFWANFTGRSPKMTAQLGEAESQRWLFIWEQLYYQPQTAQDSLAVWQNYIESEIAPKARPFFRTVWAYAQNDSLALKTFAAQPLESVKIWSWYLYLRLCQQKDNHFFSKNTEEMAAFEAQSQRIYCYHSRIYDYFNSQYFNKKDFKKAQYYLQKGLEARQAYLYQGAQADELFAASAISLASFSLMNKNNKEALILLKQAEKHWKELEARKLVVESRLYPVWDNFGTAYFQLQRYEQAIFYFEKCYLTEKKSLDLMRKLGLAYLYRKQENKALDMLTQYTEAAEKEKGKKDLLTAEAYSEMARFYRHTGNSEKTIEWTWKAEQILNQNQTHKDYASRAAVNYQMAGNALLDQMKPKEALQYFHKALALKEKQNSNKKSSSFINLAIAHRQAAQYDSAIWYYHQALTLERNNPTELSKTYNNLALAHQHAARYDSALLYLDSALFAHQQTSHKPISVLINLYNNFGELHLILKNYQKARQYLLLAEKINLENANKEDFFYENRLIPAFSIDLLITTWRKLAYLPYLEEAALTDLEQSLQRYYALDSLLETERRYAERQSDKIRQVKQGYEILQNALLLSLTLYQKSEQEKYLSDIFYFLERQKALVLWESLSEEDAKKSYLSPQILHQEQDLKQEIAYLKSSLRNYQADDTEGIALKQKLVALNHEYDRFRNTHLAQNPAYQNYLRQAEQRLEWQQVETLLGHQEALLNYALLENQVLVFAIKKGSVKIFTTPIDSTFTLQIETFNKMLAKGANIDDYCSQSSLLYKHLFAPLTDFLKNTQQIILISEGYLQQLPFESLLRPAADSKAEQETITYAQLPYLLYDYAFSYHYSAKLWHKTRLESFINQPFENANWVGFAPVFKAMEDGENQREAIAALPFTEIEVAEIGKKFRKTQIFLHQQASKENFIALASKANILHVATHSESFKKDPARSYLLFWQGEKLYADELFSMQMQTELLVLSSCRSGMGEVALGEGVLSLAHYFVQAGNRNLLYALWNISDQPTQMLMVAFYRHLETSSSYAEALQKAKIELLQQQKTVLPKFWAGFILVGR